MLKVDVPESQLVQTIGFPFAVMVPAHALVFVFSMASSVPSVKHASYTTESLLYEVDSISI
jgi:hypothetical protein